MKSKSANEILYEHGINTMELDDQFNSNMLSAMEEYKTQPTHTQGEHGFAWFWVKASERLPHGYKNVPVRPIGMDEYVNTGFYDGKAFWIKNKPNQELAEISEVEWLEKRPLPVAALPVNPGTPVNGYMEKAIELLKDYEQWEADLISDNDMWWPTASKDAISGKTYDTMLELQKRRNELLKSLPVDVGVREWISVEDKPLTECMAGRDTECNHPKCPVTDEDCKNGKYCTLPIYDWRQ